MPFFTGISTYCSHARRDLRADKSNRPDETFYSMSWSSRCDTPILRQFGRKKMTREFLELRATMTPTARLESAAVAAALPTELPLHERQRELKVQVSKNSGSA